MTLREKQSLFARLLGMLIAYAYEQGYELTMGECWRSPEDAARLGRLRSNHCERLAVDLNLFIDGVYHADSDSHAKLGAYWTSLDPLCRWGGAWGDGNHYSLEHEGRR